MQLFMQHKEMARPSRKIDMALATRLRGQMRERGWTGSDVAKLIDVDKGTISRALGTNSFSPALHSRLLALLEPERADGTSELLHKSLHILRLSDKLRRDAEAMIAKALDLIRQKD